MAAGGAAISATCTELCRLRHDATIRLGRLATAMATAPMLVLLAANLAAAHAQLDKPTPADKSTVTQPVTVVSGTSSNA